MCVARFNFENVNTPTTLAEGRSAEVCVELVSGVISVPIEVRVETGETSAAAQCKQCIGVPYSTFNYDHLHYVLLMKCYF